VELFNLKNYVALHAIVMALGVIFLLWRRPARGVRLKMKSIRAGSPSAPPPVAVHQPTVVAASSPREVVLNVHFNFNGHSFDAFEVLGLPAGTSLERVKKVHAAAVSRSDDTSREFFNAAFSAIEKLQK
jgi:hypothetical protein